MTLVVVVLVVASRVVSFFFFVFCRVVLDGLMYFIGRFFEALGV